MQTIIRTLKLKTAQEMAASDNHCQRVSQVSNADPALTPLNFEYTAANSRQEEIAETSQLRERLELMESGRAIQTPRKDSVKLVEIVMAPPPELFKDKDRAELGENPRMPGTSQNPMFEKWLYANYTFAKNHFSDTKDYTNVVSMKVHLDETTPHLHIHVMPVHKDRYNCKHYLGGSVKMQGLQDAYHKHMQEFMPEVEWERGQKKEITGKDHETVKDWYKKLAQIEKLGLSEELDRTIKELLSEGKYERQQAQQSLKQIDQELNRGMSQ